MYTDYDEMLKHPGLEAVVVATVTTVHAEQAIKAIKANKHVLCEKPLSTSVEIVRFPPPHVEDSLERAGPNIHFSPNPSSTPPKPPPISK